MKNGNAKKFMEAFENIDDNFLVEAGDYTMKKRFNFKPIVAVAACAAIAFAAVPVVNNFVNATPAVQGVETNKIGANGNFTVYEIGVHAGQILGTHKIEMSLNSKRDKYINKAKVGTKETVEIAGIEWTAKYEESLNASDYHAPLDSYTGISNGRSVTFKINSVTGKCEVFRFNKRLDTSEIELSRDELYKMAYENFMTSGYTDDPENYQLATEGRNSSGRWFKFARFVNGIETSDYIRISFRYNGEFYWYIGNNIGEMKDIDVSAIDMDKVYDALETKFKTIYADDYVGFEKGGVVLTKLNDGSYIFNCDVSANVKDGNGEIIKDTCYFAITIN